MDKALRVFERTLRIIDFFQPEKWWIENPRYGHRDNLSCREAVPFTDQDYCQYTDWGYKKPTRFWVSSHIKDLDSCLCAGVTCTNLRWDGKGYREGLRGAT